MGNTDSRALIAMLQSMSAPAMLARLDGAKLVVLGLSRSLQHEFGQHNIPVNQTDAFPEPFLQCLNAFAGHLSKSENKTANSRIRLADHSVWGWDAHVLDNAGHVMINVTNLHTVKPKNLASELGMELLVAFMEGIDRHAVIMIRDDGRISGWNMSAERLSGATGDQARGHYIDEFFDLAIIRQKRLVRILREAKKEGKWKAERVEVRRTDGSRFFANVSIRPLERVHASTTAYAVVIEDLTETLAREQEIRDTHARFRDFAESTSDWFWVMDRDLRVTEIFPDDDPRLDIIRKTYLGKAPFQIAAMSDDAVGWWEHLSQLREHKPFRDFHYVVPLSRGRKIHVAESGRPIFDKDGKFIGYRGAARNVTAEVVKERDQRHREKRLIAAVDAANNALLAFDRKGLLALWNNRTPHLMPEWMTFLQIGMHWDNFTSMLLSVARDEDIATWQGLLDKLAAHDKKGEENGPNPEAFVERIELSDGRWLEFGRYLTEDGGMGLSVTDVTVDETDQNRQRQAFKMEALGQLTGGVAHDFNNLLTVIRGNLEMLEMVLPQTVHEEHLGRVEKRVLSAIDAADRGAALTQRLLAFARKQPADAHLVSLDKHMPALKELITQAIGLDNPVSITMGPRLGNIRMDPAQFDNALLNLAINARDASEAGKPISITLSHALPADSLRHGVAGNADLDPNKDYVCISVVDSGHGIPDAIKERVFDPFFTTKGPEQGNGLGLSMVYGFARQAGGTVVIKSREGEGSSISIFLPISNGSETAPKKASASEAPDGNGETILLVEDHEGVQALMRSMMQSLNYKVQTANDGVSAKEIIQDGLEYDVLFTDMSMPGGVSGVDVAKTARNQNPKIPVVILSAHTDIVSEEARESLAPLTILDKPVARAALAQALHDALNPE